MPTPDYDDPNHGLARPGSVTLSPAALAKARALARQVGQTHPKSVWIVGFQWATSRKVRDKDSELEEDMGPGLTLGGWRRVEIPSEYVHRQDGLEFVVQIPEFVLAKSRLRLVDVDPAAFGGLAIAEAHRPDGKVLDHSPERGFFLRD